MKITPLAFDSMGVRSMATLVETDDVRILIDPAVALGPYRNGLPPHPLEIAEMKERWARIKEMASGCDSLIVTHYHYDHHNPDEPEVYEGKRVLVKHPKENINYSQKQRAAFFLKHIGPAAKKIDFSDGNRFKFGKTEVAFSRAVPHGTNSMLGYVTMVSISDGSERFLHTSDVEGPSLDEQAKFMIDSKPDVLICDGPMTYMLGYRYPAPALEASVRNLVRLIDECGTRTLVLDHHFLRDIKWKERIPVLLEKCKDSGSKVQTAAEFAGEETNLLESIRAELYKRHPADKKQYKVRED